MPPALFPFTCPKCGQKTWFTPPEMKERRVKPGVFEWWCAVCDMDVQWSPVTGRVVAKPKKHKKVVVVKR